MTTDKNNQLASILSLKQLGWSDARIAEQLGCAKQTIYRARKTAKYQELVNQAIAENLDLSRRARNVALRIIQEVERHIDFLQGIENFSTNREEIRARMATLRDLRFFCSVSIEEK